MAKFYERLNPQLSEFIARQRIFFVASAPNTGRVNVSPKGMDSLRVLDEHTVAYLDLTGSGAETAAHLRDNGRLTLMWCSFDTEPLILRLFGRGESILPGTPAWDELRPRFPELFGARQIVRLHVDGVQTSCGYAVPFYEFTGERSQLVDWSQKKGDAGLADYRRQKNRVSIDGLPTGLGTEADT